VAVICRPSDPIICNFAIKSNRTRIQQCKNLYYTRPIITIVTIFIIFYLRCFDFTLKSGTFGVPGLVLPGRGTAWHKSGTSREIRDGWQHYRKYESPKTNTKDCRPSQITCHVRIRRAVKYLVMVTLSCRFSGLIGDVSVVSRELTRDLVG